MMPDHKWSCSGKQTADTSFNKRSCTATYPDPLRVKSVGMKLASTAASVASTRSVGRYRCMASFLAWYLQRLSAGKGWCCDVAVCYPEISTAHLTIKQKNKTLVTASQIWHLLTSCGFMNFIYLITHLVYTNAFTFISFISVLQPSNFSMYHIRLLILVGVLSATALLQHAIPFLPPLQTVRPYTVSSAT